MAEKSPVRQLVDKYVLQPFGVSDEVADAVLKGKAEPEAGKLETAKDAKVDRVKALSAMGLDKLKEDIKDERIFNEFLSLSNLDGLKLEAEFDLRPDFKLKNLDAVNTAIFAKLASDKLKDLAGLLKISDDDVLAVKQAVAKIYTNSFEQRVMAKFNDSYKRAKEFLKADANASLKINVAFGPASALNVSFEDKEFKEAYDTYVAANPVAKTAEDEAREANEKQTAADKKAEDDKKAQELANTPIGKIMGFFGYGAAPEPPETMNGFQKIIAGLDPVGAFILGLFGYKQFAGDAFDGVVDMLPEPTKNKLLAVKARAAKSKLAYKDPGAEASELAKYEVFDAEKFRKLENGEIKMPANGVVLGDDIDLDKSGIGKVTMNFAKGGEMIVPKNTEVRLDGNAFLDKNGDTSKNSGVHYLEGTLPKGIVFKGNIAFGQPEGTDRANV